jgi:hypothetical protein
MVTFDPVTEIAGLPLGAVVQLFPRVPGTIVQEAEKNRLWFTVNPFRFRDTLLAEIVSPVMLLFSMYDPGDVIVHPAVVHAGVTAWACAVPGAMSPIAPITPNKRTLPTPFIAITPSMVVPTNVGLMAV